MIRLILDHLWQSTLFVAATGLLTLFLKTNSAQVRYGIWLSASLKFLFPLALLSAAGKAVSQALMPASPTPPVIMALDSATEPFSRGSVAIAGTAAAMPAPSWNWAAFLALIWFAGFAFAAIRWLRHWVYLREIVRAAVPIAIDAPIPVKSTPSPVEPGLVGIFHTVLLLPAGIADKLSVRELDTIITHEVCHWRRRDNLTAALHMAVEALFWFYPLVWWLEMRLITEREMACDEAVLADGEPPQVYAESILKVCKFYVQSPLPCAAGISGPDLKSRLEYIMRNRVASPLNIQKKALLTTVGSIVIVVPLLAGLTASPQVLAAETLDGWREFKFGMTSDQARALPAPGAPWKYQQLTIPAFRQFSNLFSKGPVKEFGITFELVALGFRTGEGLQSVQLMGARKRESADNCEKSFQTIMTTLEAQFGSFGPGYRRIAGAKVLSIPGAKSQYQYASKSVGDVELGGTIWMDARRVVGERYLDVGTVHMANGICMTNVFFFPHSPQSPSAPTYQRSN